MRQTIIIQILQHNSAKKKKTQKTKKKIKLEKYCNKKKNIQT